MNINYFDGVVLAMDTVIEFGKHQGCEVSDILQEDPDYIQHLIDSGVDVSEEVLQELS